MMVRIFKTGTGSAKSAMAYLMGKTDHQGKPRSIPPEWLHGSPSLFQLVADSTSRKHKYVSGAIAFRDNEHPSDEQVKQLVQAFKASFLPGLKECDHYADAWIAHRDKGNLELHFVVAGTEIQTGRQLNIHPPGKRNLTHFQAFTQVMNQALGYDQVVADPLKVALNDFEAKAPTGQRPRRIKTILAKELLKPIVLGQIQNRDELIMHLEDHYGEVTRVGRDFVSVRLPGSAKATRLKGPLFEEGSDYSALVKQHQEAKQPQRLTEEQYTQAKATLEQLTLERASFFAKRYKKKAGFKRGPRAGKGKATDSKTNGTSAGKAAPKAGTTTGDASINTAAREAVGVAVSQVQEAAKEIRLPKQPATALTTTPASSDSGISTPDLAGIPSNTGTVLMMELQLGNLANLLNKLTVRARTTRSANLYEVLRAQIVKLQHQMGLLSLQLEQEKAKQADSASLGDGLGKPKV